MPIITMMRSSVVLGVMGILETVFAEPDGDHGLDHPVQGKEVFFEGGFVEEVAVDDPVLVGGEVEGDGVEEAGEAVGEDHDHEEMLPESFDVVFELDEVHCGSVFEFGGVVALDELEQAEEAHHLQVLQDFDGFDASFFGYSPREAEVIEPQHRVFLECAWSELEQAGYDPQQYEGAIGVYGGSSLNSYIINLFSNSNLSIGF